MKTAVVMEELEAVEELETTENWQEENLLVRSSAGGVARVMVLWPAVVAVSYGKVMIQFPKLSRVAV